MHFFLAFFCQLFFLLNYFIYFYITVNFKKNLPLNVCEKYNYRWFSNPIKVSGQYFRKWICLLRFKMLTEANTMHVLTKMRWHFIVLVTKKLLPSLSSFVRIYSLKIFTFFQAYFFRVYNQAVAYWNFLVFLIRK